ncbi:AEC family transporter [Granulicella arctica]|uniref:Putative permease n=1 Tax=Granulicella arctica TaxID=940613 RepID=A0A7Y9PGS7_9BACT|nr:AEC family transporter [Granulicella arctica]NYF79562.1 putative permease [Granulicella arctica]
MTATTRFFLETLLPVFFVLALGHYAGWRGRINNTDTGALNTALMHFVLPCSLFLGVARTPPTVLRSQSPLLAVLALTMLFTYALVYLLERRVFGSDPSQAAVQSQTVSFSNNVAIGLPLLSSLYGPTGTLAVAAGIVSGALVISPITLVLLEWNAKRNKDGRRSLGEQLGPAILAAVRRPIVLAPVLALLLPISGYALPATAVASLDLIGKGTVGLALFLTGLILSAQRLRLQASVATGVILKNFLQPSVMLGLLFLFRLHGEVAREAFLLAAVPAGFFGTVFGARYGVRSLEASSTLVLSTALSAGTLPLAILLSSHLP